MSKKEFSDKTAAILAKVVAERQKQDAKWGEQNHNPIEWSAILTEECGEVAKEALEYHFYTKKDSEQLATKTLSDWQKEKLSKYRTELIQVAAVAVAMLESLERNELSEEKI
ncbi:MAG: hypothetical protein ACPG5B_17985 [Chitinophagales bacterium]